MDWVRHLLILVVAWPLCQCPMGVHFKTAPSPALGEIALTANEDLAAISLRYRQQIDEEIELLGVAGPDLQASVLPSPTSIAASVADSPDLCAVHGALSRYELMSLLR